MSPPSAVHDMPLSGDRIVIIVRLARRPYERRMFQKIGKLLLLLAILLMPLGMTTAATAAVQHHSASMLMQHCPDSGQQQQNDKAGFVDCTMACSAALPALALPAADPLRTICAPDVPTIERRLHGLHPETATPPPKRS